MRHHGIASPESRLRIYLSARIIHCRVCYHRLRRQSVRGQRFQRAVRLRRNKRHAHFQLKSAGAQFVRDIVCDGWHIRSCRRILHHAQRFCQLSAQSGCRLQCVERCCYFLESQCDRLCRQQRHSLWRDNRLSGRQFTKVGGQNHTGVAAVDATTGAVSSSNPQLVIQPPQTIYGNLAIGNQSVMKGTSLFTGGNFLSVGGQSARMRLP